MTTRMKRFISINCYLFSNNNLQQYKAITETVWTYGILLSFSFRPNIDVMERLQSITLPNLHVLDVIKFGFTFEIIKRGIKKLHANLRLWIQNSSEPEKHERCFENLKTHYGSTKSRLLYYIHIIQYIHMLYLQLHDIYIILSSYLLLAT